jgi:hypothetical protein
MKAALFWILLSVLWLLGRVMSTLVSDQVKAWLPGMRAWAVRRQARKMGQASAIFEEQWLADLDATPGELAKLWLVRGLFVAPVKTALERWSDSPQVVKSLLAQLALDHGWVCMTAAFLWIVFTYPPSGKQSGAYGVLLPVITVTVVFLNRRLRLALKFWYEERLSYVGRLGAGALIVPMLLSMLIAWSVVPPTGRLQSTLMAQERARPTVFFVPRTALSTDSRVNFQSVATSDMPAVHGAPRMVIVRLQTNTTVQKPRPPGLREAPLAVLTVQALPSPPFSPIELDPAEVPGQLFPLQPLPPIQAARALAPPAAPTNVRIIKYRDLES